MIFANNFMWTRLYSKVESVMILNIVDCENFREISLTGLQIVVSGNQTNLGWTLCGLQLVSITGRAVSCLAKSGWWMGLGLSQIIVTRGVTSIMTWRDMILRQLTGAFSLLKVSIFYLLPSTVLSHWTIYQDTIVNGHLNTVSTPEI